MDLDKLFASIRENEGLRLNVYTDTTGHQTIGYGHNLSNGISIGAAEQILRDDIASAMQKATSEPYWSHVSDNDARSRACVEITFNLGGLRGFPKAYSALCTGDFATASAELLDSLWHRQIGKRAERLAAMIATGNDN